MTPGRENPPPPYGTPAGATRTFAARGADEIVVTCVLNAPAEVVFAAWTDPSHLRNWLGRAGWKMTVCQSDPRPGGIRRFVWRRDDGIEMGLRGVYLDVTPHSGFVCTEHFDGATGGTVNTLRLTELAGNTTVNSTIRYATVQARDSALVTRMLEGFDQSLANLGDHLRALSASVQVATPHANSTSGTETTCR